MSTKLLPQPWMTEEETEAVFDALAAAGADARFVGGCVRDTLIGRPVGDIDIATDAVPERVIAALQAAGLKAVPTGVEHGTVTAVVNHKPFEITTLRRDVETFGRHATVAFTDDWTEDASRRDFTMNALSLSRDGALFDPFGGEADSDGMAACREMAPRLANLSAERVWAELRRLLEAPAPGPVLRLMAGAGVLQAILPEAAAFDRLDRLVDIEAAEGRQRPDLVQPDPVRRLGALVDVDAKGADALARRLRTSNAARDRLTGLEEGLRTPPESWDEKAVRRLLYRMHPDRLVDLALVLWAGGLTEPPWDAVLAEAQDWTPPVFPIAGRDVSTLGIAQGPRIGELLAAVEAWWIAEDFKPDRAACLARLRAEAGH
jgi:poly(A) polymerase